MKKYEWDEDDEYYADERYDDVISAFKNYADEDIIEYIKEILKGNKGFMCQYDRSLNFETVWSSIFDLRSLTIYRSEGNPRRCKITKDERLIR